MTTSKPTSNKAANEGSGAALLQLRKKLSAAAEPAYGRFASALLPGVEGVLGVRLGTLRRLARESASRGRPEFSRPDEIGASFEEIMVEGLSIGYSRLHEADMFRLIAEFVEKINNWSVCDSFCSTLKFMRANPAAWNFLKPYFLSKCEFPARFARVCFLFHFMESDYVDEGLKLCSALNTRAKYAVAATAWAVAECSAKFPEKALDFLKSSDPQIKSAAVRKICESLKIPTEYKSAVKSL